jgi:hypothetical protein
MAVGFYTQNTLGQLQKFAAILKQVNTSGKVENCTYEYYNLKYTFRTSTLRMYTYLSYRRIDFLIAIAQMVFYGAFKCPTNVYFM